MLPFEISSILYALTIHMLISAIHFCMALRPTRYLKCNEGFTLEYEHLQTPNSHFPAPKEQKNLPFCRHGHGPISPGTGLGCISHLLFTRPCLSHGIVFGKCVPELANVQDVNPSVAQGPAGTQLPDFASRPTPT